MVGATGINLHESAMLQLRIVLLLTFSLKTPPDTATRAGLFSIDATALIKMDDIIPDPTCTAHITCTCHACSCRLSELNQCWLVHKGRLLHEEEVYSHPPGQITEGPTHLGHMEEAIPQQDDSRQASQTGGINTTLSGVRHDFLLSMI